MINLLSDTFKDGYIIIVMKTILIWKYNNQTSLNIFITKRKKYFYEREKKFNTNSSKIKIIETIWLLLYSSVKIYFLIKTGSNNILYPEPVLT